MGRKHWFIQVFWGIVCAAAVGLLVAGCGNKDRQQVSILDGQTETRVLVEEGATVKWALEEAEISIGKQDVVEPAQDSVISKDVTEILVERFAKVSVATADQTKEVTLTGGKVKDALDAAKVTLKKDDSINHDLDACLTDGMSIEVVHYDPLANRSDEEEKGDSSEKGGGKDDAGGDSERTIVSKEKIYDCDGSGHGYYSITWSDGSVEFEDF